MLRRSEELMELRRELAFLKECLTDYADRREGYRKTAENAAF